MSVNVPLRKWRSADPAILIGRRCIARTNDDVVIDGRLELIRRRAGIEHISLGCQRIDTAARDTR